MQSGIRKLWRSIKWYKSPSPQSIIIESFLKNSITVRKITMHNDTFQSETRAADKFLHVDP